MVVVVAAGSAEVGSGTGAGIVVDVVTGGCVSTSRRPIHHVFNHHIIDFTFSFEHFENFIAEQLFKLNGIRWWAYHEGVIVVKAAIGVENMRMRMKILEITLRAVGLRAGGQTTERRPQHRLWHRHRVRLESNKDSALSRRNGSVL